MHTYTSLRAHSSMRTRRDTTICVLVRLYMCPHTAIYVLICVLIYSSMRTHAQNRDVSRACVCVCVCVCACVCVLIRLYTGEGAGSVSQQARQRDVSLACVSSRPRQLAPRGVRYIYALTYADVC